MIEKIKDPGSAITHFIGMLMALLAAMPLMIRAMNNPEKIHVISLGIFILSMVLLYAASTIYHTFKVSKEANLVLKKIDHCMIFVLIAGTYTPICLVVLNGTMGIVLLSIIWGIAFAGIAIKIMWVTCPKWFSSILYIAMGWTCVIAFTPIIAALTHEAFMWLLMGGIIYTVGGIIYALKLPIFNSRHKYFGSHEIFHLFVMAGSFCHFMLMFKFVANMPIG